jgi:signal transduction histidine kinase
MRVVAPTWTTVSTKRRFERLWRAASAVGIRTKILGIVLALVALMGVSATIQVRGMLSDALGTQLKERGISVTRDLAARSTDLILVNDRYALYQLLRDTLINNPDVRYAFIVDPQGQVIAHTFNGGFPADLLTANSAAATDHHHTLSLATDEGPMWDTAVPIFDGRAGTARVGISDVSVHSTVGAATSQLLLTTIIVAAIGISAATLLTWVLTRPILDLVRAAHSVGRADFSQRTPHWANDEIGELAEAFNAMTAALAKADAERAEREQLRAQYVSGVIAAQEDERKRIARELHDSTSQSLTSLLIGLRALTDHCEQPDIRQRAEDLRLVASHTLDDVHTLALQLRPSVLDDLGLPAALARHVADCRRRHELQIDLAITGLSDRRLPPEIETALYRIVQESLGNVVRHAHAQTASVLIECSEHKVRAIIEDDGIGFDSAVISATDGHLGLYSIRERAELLGGSLMIETEPSHGASLFVEIPLPSQEVDDA